MSKKIKELYRINNDLKQRFQALKDQNERIIENQTEKYDRLLNYLGIEEEDYAEIEEISTGFSSRKAAIKKTRLVKKEKEVEVEDITTLAWLDTSPETKVKVKKKKKKKHNYKAWSRKEVEFLRENKTTMSKKGLARELGRSVPCINAKIYRMNK